ncbi:MAG: hypothetical protein D6743_11240, partial [Calditrichaeota bacterium]
MKMRPPKSNLSLLAALILLVGAALSCEKPKPSSPIIVKVGEEALTLEDLKHTVPEELQNKVTREELQEFISRWINAHILYEEGRKLGLLQKPEIQQKIHEFEVGIVGNAYLETVLETNPLVTDSAVAAYYEKNRDDFVRNSLEYHLQHILVHEKKTADSIRTVLLRGVPFDSLARKFAHNLPEGMSWDLGYVSEDDLIPEISSRLKAYRVGRVTRPIKTDFGYHIFKIVDKKDRGTLKPLEEVREAIVARIEQDLREEKYRQVLNELKTRAHIETNFQLLNKI